MLAALAGAIGLVLLVDRLYGHSNLAFAAAIILLVIANTPMLRFNCPQCGKNLFFRRGFAVPWPNRTCGACGHDCDAAHPRDADG